MDETSLSIRPIPRDSDEKRRYRDYVGYLRATNPALALTFLSMRYLVSPEILDITETYLAFDERYDKYRRVCPTRLAKVQDGEYYYYFTFYRRIEPDGV